VARNPYIGGVKREKSSVMVKIVTRFEIDANRRKESIVKGGTKTKLHARTKRPVTIPKTKFQEKKNGTQ